MFKSYFLKYEVELEGVRRECVLEVATHDSIWQVRRTYRNFPPIIFEDEEKQRKLKFSLKSVEENLLGPYWNS